jgi:hypothetical protein
MLGFFFDHPIVNSQTPYGDRDEKNSLQKNSSKIEW